MGQPWKHALIVLVQCLLLAQLAAALRVSLPSKLEGKGSKPTKRKESFTSPTGLFIQERASKQLPGPGQHFSFGALKSWDDIHAVLDSLPESKLVFLIRHGQAVSNFLADTLGPDEWFRYEDKCSYTDSNNTFWGIFDAELTDLGRAEAVALNSMLNSGGWFQQLTKGKPAHAIVSPLSRCLLTCKLALDGLSFTGMEVEDNVRETLGEDTCDARRSASNPHDKTQLVGPCEFEVGLRDKFPEYKFPVKGVDVAVGEGFGLEADEDNMWTKDRETQSHQTKRATRFLSDLFNLVEDKVVFVVTHSGFTRSVLLAVGREPYRPQNTELVPVIIMRNDPWSRAGEQQEEGERLVA